MKLKKIIFILIIISITAFINVQEAYALYAGDGGSSKSSETVDDIMGNADKFIDDGETAGESINEEELKGTIDFLYNLFLGVGIIVAVIVGTILGIKYMMGSIEEKASLKEMLVPYIAGCVVVFGAFGIWKLVINILSNT